jgi:hypothetical protein
MSTPAELSAKLRRWDVEAAAAFKVRTGREAVLPFTSDGEAADAIDSLQAQVEVLRRALQSVHRLMASADTDSMDNDEDAALFMAVRWQVSCALTQSSDAEMGEKT